MGKHCFLDDIEPKSNSGDSHFQGFVFVVLVENPMILVDHFVDKSNHPIAVGDSRLPGVEDFDKN
jgi:hypothetical protein